MRRFAKMISFLIKSVIFIAVIVLAVNFYVVFTTSGDIVSDVKDRKISFSTDQAEALNGNGAQCVLVLGAAVKPDGTPSEMLRHRLDVAIELYRSGFAPKLLFSGDNGSNDYNEVGVMRKYAMSKGVPSEDIFLDHAGFSTYESVYRARDIFCVSRMIIVTQKYHIYRALYIADKLGLDAVGVGADQRAYEGQMFYSAREVLARDKDVIKCITQPKPTYLGHTIDITGSGDVTGD